MAFKEKEIYEELFNILKNDADLSYIKQFYKGWRQNIPQDCFPCISLEPQQTTEEVFAVPYKFKILYDIRIIAEIYVFDYNNQILGTDTKKGILDIANDIKKVILKYPDLNGKCIKFNFISTNYIFENFPFRRCEITIRFEVITSNNER